MPSDDAPPQLSDVPEAWPVVASEDLYRGSAPFAIRSDRLHHPDGSPDEAFSRIVVEHPGAVVVLAMDDDERVLCLRQYRHPTQQRMLELPAGLLDVAGEDPRQAGERELLEEAGLEAAAWTHLVSAFSSPGIIDEKIHYFLARGLREAHRGDFEPAHEEADMDTLWVPFSDLLDACLDGRVHDAPVLIAVLTARQRDLAG